MCPFATNMQKFVLVYPSTALSYLITTLSYLSTALSHPNTDLSFLSTALFLHILTVWPLWLTMANIRSQSYHIFWTPSHEFYSVFLDGTVM